MLGVVLGNAFAVVVHPAEVVLGIYITLFGKWSPLSESRGLMPAVKRCQPTSNSSHAEAAPNRGAPTTASVAAMRRMVNCNVRWKVARNEKEKTATHNPRRPSPTFQGA